MIKNNCRQALIEKIEASVTQSEVMAGSVKTTYLSAGSGHPVICLHGGGGGGVTWYQSIGPLAQYFHVIAPDIVGYGESDKPDAPYDRPYFASWLKSLLLALGISRAHIIGLSQGGAIALQFTLDNPEMVDKLILVDSGALGIKPPLIPLLAMLWANSFPSVLASRVYSRYLFFNPENRDPNLGQYGLEVLMGKDGKKAFAQGRGSAVSAMPEASLRKITNKTLVVWGDNDRLFSVDHAVTAVTKLPNATLFRIKDAGHLPFIDQPAIFNKAILDFLNA